MAKKNISYKFAKLAVLDALSEFGFGKVIPGGSCKYYEPSGEPVCLVGQVFARAGYTYQDLGEAANVTDVTSTDVTSKVRMTPKALRFLKAAQESQDTQHSWGEAYISAETYINEVE